MLCNLALMPLIKVAKYILGICFGYLSYYNQCTKKLVLFPNTVLNETYKLEKLYIIHSL